MHNPGIENPASPGRLRVITKEMGRALVVSFSSHQSFSKTLQDSSCKLFHKFIHRNLSAFVMTETELNDIAAAAIIGLNNSPVNGYRMPAAKGTPSAL